LREKVVAQRPDEGVARVSGRMLLLHSDLWLKFRYMRVGRGRSSGVDWGVRIRIPTGTNVPCWDKSRGALPHLDRQ
jgi:hypothetical protein